MTASGWLPDNATRPERLRRPRDLKAEIGIRSADDRSPEQNGWPAGFAAASADRDALLVLLSLPSLTARILAGLAAREGSAAGCLRAVERGEAASDHDRERLAAIEPSEIRRSIDAARGRFVAVGDPEYPCALADLADPPAGLFARGRPLNELLPGPVPPVAIVGSRTCSAAGAEVASQLGSGLASAGACVVSGGAIGIDAAAHRGALSVGGGTVAVLGCGIDVVYPRTNRELFERLGTEAAVIGEYPPGTPPEPFRFPARNRIVAALAHAVVVVEGAEGSGSMITVEHATDLGREILAVPGLVTGELSQVPNQLIRDGARLVRGPGDVLEDLGAGSSAPEDAVSSPALPGDRSAVRGDRPAAAGDRAAVPGDHASAVLAAINGPTAPDRIAQTAGIAHGPVLTALLDLELRGLVRAVGGRYERVASPRRGARGRPP
jgi:DNA processing protein